MKQIHQIIRDCRIGKRTKIWSFVNLYECTIGDDCMIGAFVEVQQGATIGDKVRIQSHTFICDGVTIEDEVFIGHGVMFINETYPRVTTTEGRIILYHERKLTKTRIGRRASIGSNATILGGISIGENAIVGAGAIVTKNVPKNTIVIGNPARVIKEVPDKI